MNKNTNQPIGSTCDNTVFVGTPEDKTLQDHNKDTREDFDEKFPQFYGVGSPFPIFTKTPNRNYIWQFIETQNKAILLKERQRITTIIDSIEEFDEPSCLADESLLLAIKREIKDKVNL